MFHAIAIVAVLGMSKAELQKLPDGRQLFVVVLRDRPIWIPPDAPECFEWSLDGKHPDDAPYYPGGLDGCIRDKDRAYRRCMWECEGYCSAADVAACRQACHAWRMEWYAACQGVITYREWLRPYLEEQERLRSEKMAQYEANRRRAMEHNRRVRAR